MSYKAIKTDFRKLIVGVDAKVPLANGMYITAVNFDNAATTPPFLPVLKEVTNFSVWYSSIHRGKGYKSMLSSDIYENARKVICDFVHSDENRDVIIYTKCTTESINALACVLAESKNEQDVVLSTFMEHSANDLPWRGKFNVDYIAVDSLGRLCLRDLESKLRKYSGRVRLVAVTGASNVTGYINPVYEIARVVHNHSAKILVDGAQLVPHARVDMKPWDSPEHIDYLVFSAHKMYAPFGIGVLIGPRESFEEGEPFCKGGGAAKLVTHKRIEWDEPPLRDEAGSPNIMGVVALVSAIRTLKSIGMDTIYRQEEGLLDYALCALKNIPGIKIYGQTYTTGQRIGIIPFNINGIHHQLLAGMLSFEAGIAVRNGFFCAHPYSQSLLNISAEDMDYYFENPEALRPGMVRISFGLYNDYSEIDRLIYSLYQIAVNKKYYLDKYSGPNSFFRFTNDV